MNYKDLGNPYQTERLQLYNCDCIELLRQTPDNYYQLCIADPPYGIGAGSKKFINRNTKNIKAEKFYKDNDWDIKPSESYFNELKRVAQKYIVWGGNYFIDHLDPCRCYIVWDKKTGDNSYADCEIALTNIDENARIYTKFWLGAHANNGTERIHPTEKPIGLYSFLLQTYAKAGDKILDTHLGSMSHAIAAHYAGFNLTGCELDPDYFAAGIERVKRETAQMDMFADAPKIAQAEQLFLDTPSK